MQRVLREESALSEIFLSCLLVRNAQIQDDLINHLFNTSEKRLARILLSMAESIPQGSEEIFIPKISQEALAAMVGTTRSRVSYFMNRFRKLGHIEYKRRIRVNKSLINIVLSD
jgi:CRP/FNR family transcriptional regulator, cyclic AMP receptor protein